jgi:hypothetical protein
MHMRAISDARQSPRMHAKIPVSLLLESQDIPIVQDTFTIDISTHGMRVKIQSSVWPGQPVEVISTRHSDQTVSARVIWVHANSATGIGEAGLKFSRPLPDGF